MRLSGSRLINVATIYLGKMKRPGDVGASSGPELKRANGTIHIKEWYHDSF